MKRLCHWLDDHFAYLIGLAGIGATVLAIVLLNGCATKPIMTAGIPNLCNVTPSIWRGGQPEAYGWEFLKSQGVTNVIKLNTFKEGDDGPALAHGMSLLYLPITTAEQTVGRPERETLDAAVAAIKPGTFIHCRRGEDRTGLVVALWRVRTQAWTKAQAHAEMIARGFHPMLRGLMRVWEDEPEHESNRRTKTP